MSNPDNIPLADAQNGFFLYSQSQQTNVSSIKGYYAELNMVNDDVNNDVELFRVGVEVSESSK